MNGARKTIAVACMIAAVGVWARAAVEIEPVEKKPVVQLAILLDTSNSMDGLIDQAKSQLWRIVNEFATAKYKGERPDLEVALFQYGNNSLPAGEGHVQMVVPLTTDLDRISEKLFALTTNGGNEFCGWVIKDAVEGLDWSRSNEDLKLLFIAGNEPFTQGKIDYRKSCRAAIEKGIVVNTIHCGSEKAGIDGKWKNGADLADGQFATIDQNRAIAHIEAPQDAEIARLGIELNGTYIPYGDLGEEGRQRQEAQEENTRNFSRGSFLTRQVTKATTNYRNGAWDLVDAIEDGTIELGSVKKDDLPEEMQKMSDEERTAYVEQQAKKRSQIQEQIRELNGAREKYVAEQRRKLSEGGDETLDTAIVKIVREQAKARNFELTN